MSSYDSKIIAKNTLFLYLRMIIVILVNLYSVKLLWELLGIEDYGIYSVVGGIVLMFAFLNNAMISTSQRFISFELGRGDEGNLQKTFSISLYVHFLLAIIIVLLAETVGLWFLNYRMNIPIGRLHAANWVYQCSIGAFLCNVISVPYNACIVAHEHMKVYGYLGIVDVLFKLIAVLILTLVSSDRLIVYSVLIFFASVIMRIAYGVYCTQHFRECKFKFFRDPLLIRQMFSFAGWSFLGNMGLTVRDQGINILLNIFFNVSVNAAKGVAGQISGAVNAFSYYFTMAVNPQITKLYASGDLEGMKLLLVNGCRLALMLMSFVVIPLLIAAKLVLKLWLGDVAEYTIGFLQLALIVSLIDCVISPIITALQATGKIKKFQIIVSIIMLSNLPFAWLWLKLDANPYVVMWLVILTSLIALIARLKLLQAQINFSFPHFLYTVYLRNIPSIIISALLSWLIFPLFALDFGGLIGFTLSSIGIIISISWCIAINKKERQTIICKVSNFFINKTKN